MHTHAREGIWPEQQNVRALACNAGSRAAAALYGGLGGGFSKAAFPTRNLNSLKQAKYFGPKTVGGALGSSNAWMNNGSFATSSAVGGAANFPAANPDAAARAPQQRTRCLEECVWRDPFCVARRLLRRAVLAPGR